MDCVVRKISYDNWADIRRYKEFHRDEAIGYKFYLYHFENDVYQARAIGKWWVYILLFIPAHILNFFYCLWDGGLRDFSIERRPRLSSTIYPKDKAHEVCEEISKNAKSKHVKL